MSSSDFNPYQMMISASEMAYYPSPYGNYMSYGSLGPWNGTAGPFYGAASYGTPCHVPYANMGFSNGYFPMTEGSVPVDNLGAPTETKFPVGSGESINQGPPTSGDQSDSREEQPSPKNHGDEESDETKGEILTSVKQIVDGVRQVREDIVGLNKQYLELNKQHSELKIRVAVLEGRKLGKGIQREKRPRP